MKKIITSILSVGVLTLSVGALATTLVGCGSTGDELTDEEEEQQYTVEGDKIVYDDYSLTFSYLDDAVEITGIEGNTVNVTIPASIPYGNDVLPITTIGDDAFANCTVLTEIDCSSVTTIGERAFKGCYQLESIDCPNVETIGVDAFYGCESLKRGKRN